MSNKRIYTADAPPVFKRWAPALLEDAPVVPVAAPPPAPAAPLLDYLAQQDDRLIETDAAQEEAAAVQLAAEELEALREEAQREGYTQGLAEGRLQGEVDARQLQAVLKTMQVTLEQLQNNLAPQVLDLAVDLARHILRSELQTKPEHIIALVQEMVQALPQPGGHPRLRLHPEDADLTRTILGAELDITGWKIVPDSSLQRGDCIIETHHGEMNASLATRWQQLCENLGVTRPLDDEPA